MKTWTAVWAMLAGLAGLPALAADNPVDQVLRMTPADTGGVLIVQDFATVWEQIKSGPAWAQVQQTPMYRLWRQSPGYEQFQQGKARFEQTFGDIESLVKNAAGRCVVLAFSPPAVGQAPRQAGRGVVLSWVTDLEAFRALLAKVEEVQRREGKLLRVTDKPIGSFTCQERVSRGRTGVEQTQYWALAGHVFVVTDDEPLMKAVLTLGANPGAGSLAVDPTFQAAMSRLPAGAPVRLYLNARAFDAVMSGALTKAAAQSRPGAPFVAAVIGSCWPAVRSVAGALELAGGATLRLEVDVEEAKLPAPLRAWRASSVQPTALWQALPASPMGALVGHVDTGALVDLVEQFGDPRARHGVQVLKRLLQALLQAQDVKAEVLSRIGPDVAAFVTCPKRADGSSGVPRLTAIVRVDGTSPGPGRLSRIQEELDVVLDRAMRLVLGLRQAQDPSSPALIQRQSVGPSVIKYLPHMKPWPEGLIPGYAFYGQWLVIGSNKDEVAGAIERLAGSAPAGGKLAELRASRFAGAQDLVYIDLQQCQAAIRTHRQWLAAREQAKGQKTAEQIARDQDTLLSLLDLVDAFYWAKTVRPDGTSHVISLVGAAK